MSGGITDCVGKQQVIYLVNHGVPNLPSGGIPLIFFFHRTDLHRPLSFRVIMLHVADKYYLFG